MKDAYINVGVARDGDKMVGGGTILADSLLVVKVEGHQFFYIDEDGTETWSVEVGVTGANVLKFFFFDRQKARNFARRIILACKIMLGKKDNKDGAFFVYTDRHSNRYIDVPMQDLKPQDAAFWNNGKEKAQEDD